MVLRQADVDAEYLALTFARHADGAHHGQRDDTPALPHLVEGRVQPHVGVLTLDGSVAEGLDLFVESLADARDLGAGDAVKAEGTHEVVDLARGDPMHVGLLDHVEQRLLRAQPRFEQRREIGAWCNLGDAQLDRAHAGVPPPVAITVAVCRAIVTSLVGLGADLRAHLGVHQRLSEHANTFSQHIDVVVSKELAHERAEVHPVLGHRSSFTSPLNP